MLAPGFYRPGIPVSPPTLVFHCYLSVPLVPFTLSILHNWVKERLLQPISKWIVFLDPRASSGIGNHIRLIPVLFLPPSYYGEEWISEKVRFYVSQYLTPGTVVLIVRQGQFPRVQELKFYGWKLIVFHPPGAPRELASVAHEAFELPVYVEPEDESKEILAIYSYDEIRQRSTLLKPESMTPLSSSSLDRFIRTFRAMTSGPKWPIFHREIRFKQSFEEFLLYLGMTAESTLMGILEEMNDKGVEGQKKTASLMAPIGTKRKQTYKDELPKKKSEEEEEKKTLANVMKTAIDRYQDSFSTSQKLVRTPPRVSTIRPLKYSAQCPKLLKEGHLKEKCVYWHPRINCEYFPRCRTMADKCGYGHPFCHPANGPCGCDPQARNPQLNHNLGHPSQGFY